MQGVRLRLAHTLTLAVMAFALIVFPFSGMRAMTAVHLQTAQTSVADHQHAEGASSHSHVKSAAKAKIGCDGQSHDEDDASCCGLSCHVAVLTPVSISPRVAEVIQIVDITIDAGIMQVRPSELHRPPRTV